ncbi:MAG: DUF5615 family PIN-like protein [Planctomycetes bacterium]|nr:DUF5615 family PIN-like protein [Planctomycetota bacterium]
MSLLLYMDVHVHRGITLGLRRRGIDVLTSQEDETTTLPDDLLLDRASQLRRILFSQDRDFLRETSNRLSIGRASAGVVYAHPLRVPIGTCIADLEILAKLCTPEEMANQVIYLPL